MSTPDGLAKQFAYRDIDATGEIPDVLLMEGSFEFTLRFRVTRR